MDGKKSFRELVKGSWAATAGERPRFFAFLILYVLAYTLDLATPWAIGYSLGVFIKGGLSEEAYQQAFYGIALYTALKLVHFVCHHTARYLQNTVTFQARMYVLTDIFSHLMCFPLRWHMKSHSGENLSKLYRSAGAVEGMIGTFVWQVVEGMVKVVGATICILALDYRIALNVFLFSGLTVLTMIFFNKRLRDKIRKNNAFGNKLNAICIDYLFNIVTVKTLGLEKPAIRYFQDQKQHGLPLSKAISKYQELKWSTTGVGYSLVIGSSLLLYFHNHRGFAGPFDVAEVYVLLNYLDRIFQAIGSFTAYYSGMMEASTSYEDAIAIQEQALLTPHQRPTLPAIKPDWKTVGLNQLHFAYERDQSRGLHGVELQVKKGEKIALVGPSGGGKSTILKVMAGLLSPDSCSVSTNLETALDVNQLIPLCLLVPQEPEIFSESVRYNLTMGEEIPEAKIWQVIELCHLGEVLKKLPEGIDSNLVEKGLNLSVGEKQRIALARGLLRVENRPILLLDEPTSSLDPSTERDIFKSLLEHYQERTIITACHRLALIPLFDKIVYVAQGKIVEAGSFAELLEKKGAFYRAWEAYERRKTKEEPAALEEVPLVNIEGEIIASELCTQAPGKLAH
jgi:ATP-binding cassette subfamily B protein